MMNASGPAATAKRSPPPPPRITSFTSLAKSAGTTSLAEALATSVADYVCDRKNRAKNNNSAPKNNSSKNNNPTTLRNTTNNNSPSKSPPTPMKSTMSYNNNKKPMAPRIVSAEHPTTTNSNNNSKLTSTSTSTTTTTMTMTQVKAKCVRVTQPPACKKIITTTPRTVSASCSSMSSAVADLASGMSIFKPSLAPRRDSSTSGINNNGSNVNNMASMKVNVNQNTHTYSAPMISGTAAAVLALQSTSDLFNAHGNINAPSDRSSSLSSKTTSSSNHNTVIVSNPSSVESRGDHQPRGGILPHPLILPAAASTSTSTAASFSPRERAQSQGSATSTTSPRGGSVSASIGGTCTSPKFPTRYADGAPIIAGTAAAQMEAIATATAARITSIANDGGMISEEAINAVASLGVHHHHPNHPMSGGGALGDYDQFGADTAGEVELNQGIGSSSSASHGFDASAMGWGGGVVKTVSRNNTPNRGGSGGSNAKALSWVDHRYQNTTTAGAHSMQLPQCPRVTPDDGSSPPAYNQASMMSMSAPQQRYAQHQPTETIRTEKGTAVQSVEGGMDILAEIICHAPPMSLPQGSTTQSIAYPSSQHHQEMYQQAPRQQQAQQHHHHHQVSYSSSHSQQAQDPQSLSPSPSIKPSSHNNSNQQRVSAIPSYQEIYQEMGMSSPREHQHAERREQRRVNTAQHHLYSTCSYSVEEVEVDPSKSQDSSGNNSSMHHTHRSLSYANNNNNNNNNTIMKSSNGTTTTNPRTMSHHYNHRPSATHFGHVSKEDIEEGKELYTRRDLMHFGGHLGEQKDVHGSMKEGCDSICVGSLEKDIREGDGLAWFFYSTDRSNGGGALCQSYHKKRPIRVFRSSLLGGRYAPPFLDIEDDEEGDSDVGYRYDGLYNVCAVWDVNGRETESFPAVGQDGWQTYFFTRVPKKPLPQEKVESGVQYNAMGLQELWSTLQKMKGAKRPKKFEIPQPLVKLQAMKKASISGVYKDRKNVGWKRPEPPAAPLAPKPPSQPRVKSPKASPNEKPELKEKEPLFDSDSSTSSSSDEEEEETNNLHRSKDRAKEEDDESESDSDVLPPKPHTTTPLSAQTASKVMTPRPRMNSMPQSPEKPLPSTAHDDSSSDSETESTTPPQKIVQQNKRARTPSSKQKQLLNNKVIDFLPKRATAAKAEAANRNMLGSHRTYNKRKTAETPPAPAPAPEPEKPPPRVSNRKKAKVQQYDESSSDEEEVEEEEEPEPDVVDQSVLTIGSRVLVVYKGSLFKASIRKRRFKNKRHDFLIHYDGNKRTNVHWVPLERLSEILEINVDTPAKKKKAPVVGKKQTAAASAARRKSSNGNKRKAESQILRQESLQTNHYSEQEGAPTKQEASSKSDDEELVLLEEVPLPSVGGEEERKEVIPMNEACESSGHKEPSSKEVALPSKNAHVEKVDGNESSTNEKKVHPVKEATQLCPVEKCEEMSREEENEQTSAELNAEPEEDNEQSIHSTKSDTIHEEDDGHSPSDWVEDILTGDIQESPPIAPDSKTAGFEMSDANKCQEDKTPEMMDTEEAGDEPTPEFDKEDSPKMPISKSNFKTTTATSAAARKPRTTVVSDAGVTNLDKKEITSPNLKDPLAILAEEAGSDSGELGSDKDSDENSTSSSGNAKPEQSTSEPTSEFKYPVGGNVYVEYRQIFYSSTILKARRKRSASEYLVHYGGYKKSSNRWTKENTIHEVNVATTQRFEDQRFIPADILYEAVQPPHFTRTSRRKKTTSESSESPSLDITARSSISPPKKSSPPKIRSDTSETSGQTALDNLEPGVIFLPGSMVFVEWTGGLYLAKMLKKRYSGNRMEYFISYDGFKNNHDAWVSIHKIYEVNPQTKRVFKSINSELLGGTTDDKPKRRAPPGPPRRRETRKKAQDYDDIVSHSSAAQVSKLRNNGDVAQLTTRADVPQPPSRASSRAQPSPRAQPSQPIPPPSSLDMQGIEAGVEFLPGSTVFAEYKGGLCLAKMIKKRGKGDYMEYFIGYTGLKRTEEAWLSISLIYEINPQTKRMFRKLSKK